MFKTPILMLKMKFFWLIFRGKFEQKTQKSIFLKNQWRLKNIKKAMVVKNIIAEDMPFTKSIFEQFWRSYCKKTIFVVFHFLKFLPIWYVHCPFTQLEEPDEGCLRPETGVFCFQGGDARCNENMVRALIIKLQNDFIMTCTVMEICTWPPPRS